MEVPFSKTRLVGNEESYLLESLRSGQWQGRGPKTIQLEKKIKEKLKVKHALFVNSGSAALEIGCLIANINSGDEVILPSFGFSSSANAIIRAGGVPVFVDIDKDTWNISIPEIEKAITRKTKAIMNVHYAGSLAGSGDLRELCKKKGIFLIEDAAQSLGAKTENGYFGRTPWVTCFSLHGTKNIACGEGGIVATDDDNLATKIEIIIEKGTNRQNFIRGQVDKYTWVDLGSSFVASDLLAAVALAQFEKIDEITDRRREVFNKYKKIAEKYPVKLQKMEAGTEHNGHIFGFLVEPQKRNLIIDKLKAKGVGATFHFVPLHSSPMGMKFKNNFSFENTNKVADSIIRLPIFSNMANEEIDFVCSSVNEVLKNEL